MAACCARGPLLPAALRTNCFPQLLLQTNPLLLLLQVLDAAKASADQLGVPVACCPTVASSDAPCSALSVIYTPQGVVEEIRYYK